MEIVYRMYRKVSDLTITKKMLKIYKSGTPWANAAAERRMRKLSQAVHGKGPVRVAFLAQVPSCWNKLQSVFEAMQKDPRFAPFILVIPDDVSKAGGDALSYFRGLYGEDVIEALEGDRYYDLRAASPEYVFYQRPYDHYLPAQYRTGTVSAYAKPCYVTYGFEIFGGIEDVVLSKIFMRNIYLYLRRVSGR